MPMPLASPHISLAVSRRWFFIWDDIGVHLGWVWRGKAREAARIRKGSISPVRPNLGERPLFDHLPSHPRRGPMALGLASLAP
jgi:hypothetical protein